MINLGSICPRRALRPLILKIFNFLNVDPFKQVGPLPFELEIGIQWYVPYLTYQTYGYTASWIKISSYFQAW